MYFVIIMAFALVLSDALPSEPCNIFGSHPFSAGVGLWGTLAIVFAQLLLILGYAIAMRRATLKRIDGSHEGHDEATDLYGWYQQILLFVLSGFLILTLVCTPWTRIVRETWRLEKLPLVPELVILGPLFLSLLIIWVVNYGAELKLRAESLGVPTDGHSPAPVHVEPPPRETAAFAALQASRHRQSIGDLGLKPYLLDKIRHQVLILAAPMCIIVFAKFWIHGYLTRIVPLPRDPLIRDIILNSALGCVSVVVLVIAPWLLRFIWATEPLPAGALRDRFVSTCDRIGLRYREILLWHTHGATVNAAVMGFVAPLRYILVSDALLETMEDDEIEAVFGHEAGHVCHWHLPFFGAFAIASMYIAGGMMHLLLLIERLVGHGFRIDNSILQLSALAVLLLMWLFGFAWLSRKFERQADLFGVRCITPDVGACLQSCPIHGAAPRAGLCISAANIFGRTLGKIADLNGIPREAPSWRHGSIGSRCRLLEQFVSDTKSLRNFDRKIVKIKIGLVVAVLIGSAGAVMIYYRPVMAALHTPQPRVVVPGVSSPTHHR